MSNLLKLVLLLCLRGFLEDSHNIRSMGQGHSLLQQDIPKETIQIFTYLVVNPIWLRKNIKSLVKILKYFHFKRIFAGFS